MAEVAEEHGFSLQHCQAGLAYVAGTLGPAGLAHWRRHPNPWTYEPYNCLGECSKLRFFFLGVGVVDQGIPLSHVLVDVTENQPPSRDLGMHRIGEVPSSSEGFRVLGFRV